MYLLDDFENAVFKFTDIGEGNYCTAKFKGEKEYRLLCTSNLAFEAFLSGNVISEKEYNEF